MTVGFDAPHIGLVVEGPGDKGAVPKLLRDHLGSSGDYRDVLSKPVTLKGKGAATRPMGIEGFVQAAARPGAVGVLVILDADRDASCELGPHLLERAQAVVQIPVVVAIAEVDFEDWIYASVERLGLGDVDWDPSARGKAKLIELLAPQSYTKTVWQPKLASRMDLSLSRLRNRSLDRTLKKFDQLVAGIA